MLRRLHPEQPDSFAYTPANLEWAQGQISKYPEGRQASAVIPLLWRAQEQEGWLTKPAIEYVGDLLGMAYIRVLEVASFYFMFQLQPVGTVAHIQVCGTTTCMICGAEDLVAVCKDKIAPKPHMLSADGKFSWEEVECLGSCANAPMAQIGKDYYEDLTAESFAALLDGLAAGDVPVPGPQNGRFASEPLAGLSSLTEHDSGRTQYNASVALATEIGDTIKRIDGTEVPILTPWLGKPANADVAPAAPETAPVAKAEPVIKPSTALPGQQELAQRKGSWRYEARQDSGQPETLTAPRGGVADDLKQLKGVGPKLEQLLNGLGIYHFDQVAAWTPAQVAWVDDQLSFKGRIDRDGWIEQARALTDKT